MRLVALFAHSPDAAIMGCVLGTLLIYLEFNRPGRILPGATGLLLLLLGVAGLTRHSVNFAAFLCLVSAALMLFWGLRHRTSWVLGATATVAMAAGCRHLIRTADGPQIHLLTAAAASLLLGPGTFLLTAIARRARVNKGLD